LLQATLRFYEELNDFLPEGRRKRSFSFAFSGNITLGEVLDALEVPRDHVELILVRGESVDFSQRLRDGDRASFYPVFEAIDVRSLIRVRSQPLRTLRFVTAAGFDRLAVYLRLCGLDTIQDGDSFGNEALRHASAEGRVLITNDDSALRRRLVSRACLVCCAKPRQQLLEVLSQLDMWESLAPLSRCLACNEPLEKTLPGRPGQLQPSPGNEGCIRRCSKCGKIYADGVHMHRLRWLVGEVLAGASD